MKKHRLIAWVLVIGILILQVPLRDINIWASSKTDNKSYTASYSNASKDEENDDRINNCIEKVSKFIASSSNASYIASNSNALKKEDTKGISFKEEIEDYIIYINSEGSVLPENTKVDIKKIQDVEGFSIYDLIQNQISEESKLQTAVAFDITFLLDGKEIQPEGAVEVRIEKKSGIDPKLSAKLFHIDEDTEIEEIKVKEREDNAVYIDADRFSVYALALTSEDIIHIYTVEDFLNMSGEGNYLLESDLDFSEVNGFSGVEFNGSLDGNGHTISNITIDISDKVDKRFGIFPYIRELTNINFEEIKIYGSLKTTERLNIGGIVGYNISSASNVNIDKLIMDLEVEGEVNQNFTLNLGGFSGTKSADLNNIRLSDCEILLKYIYGDVYIGGIAAGGYMLNASGCIFDGRIDVRADRTKETADNRLNIGGITYRSYGKLDNCINNGFITANVNNGYYAIGGIITSSSCSNISQIANFGDISIINKAFPDEGGGSASLADGTVGGLIGSAHGEKDIGDAIFLKDSFNAGDIYTISYSDWFTSETLTPDMGCIIGEVYYNFGIENCYNAGDIFSDRYSEDGSELIAENVLGNYVGIFAGSLRYIYDVNELIINSYYFDNHVEIPIIGHEYNNGVGSCKYLDKNERNNRESFVGFDFESVWQMGNDEYPYPVFNQMPDDDEDVMTPDPSDLISVGWEKLDSGEIIYYDENGELLKNGRYKLRYITDQDYIYEGYWRFDEKGHVISGTFDGHIYYDKTDGMYPFGMEIDKDVRELAGEIISPADIMASYNNYVSTFLDDLSFFDKLYASDPSDGLEQLIGAFPSLWSSFGAPISSNDFFEQVNRNYEKDVTLNKKVIERILEKKFSDESDLISEEKVYRVSKNGLDKLTDGFADEFKELLKEKRTEYNNNPNGDWSESYKELMMTLDKDEEDSYYSYITNNAFNTMFEAFELGEDWAEVFFDYSERIEFLESLYSSASSVEENSIFAYTVKSIIDDYNDRFINTLANSIYTIIEESNSWRTVITGSDSVWLPEWDFSDTLENNVIKNIANGILKSIKLLNLSIKGVELIQKLDGRGPAINDFIETETLYEEALTSLILAEKEVLKEGAGAEELLNYINLFDFVRYMCVIRYESMKDFYIAEANHQVEKNIKIDFLENEVEKLKKMTIVTSPEFMSSVLICEWNDNEKKYYFYRDRTSTDKVFLNDGWQWIDGEKYYFDAKGAPLEGLNTIVDINGEYKYYFSTGSGEQNNTDHYGAMQTGFIKINGKQYYFDERSGQMAQGTWIQTGIGEPWYYFDENGILDDSSYLDPDNNLGSIYKKGFQTVKVNCPVNVYVYDGSNIVACIEDDSIYSSDSNVTVEIDHNEQKVIQTPVGDNYSFKIIAEGNGTMDYSLVEYPANSSESRKIDYRNIVINKGDEYLGFSQKSSQENTYIHLLVKENLYIPVTEVQKALSVYNIDLASDGNGNVIGDNYAVRGDFIKLIAEASEGSQFIGWYDENNELVSSDPEMRIRVLSNQTLTAHFSDDGNTDEIPEYPEDNRPQESVGSSSGGSTSGPVGVYYADRSASLNTLEIAGVWQQDSSGWKYQLSNGVYPTDMWYECEWNGKKHWYHFNAESYLDSGWFTDIDGNIYYLHPDHDGNFGYMYTGWNTIGGKNYYFSMDSASGILKGALLKNTVTPDGHNVGEDGAQIQ